MREYKFKVGDTVRIKDNYPVGEVSTDHHQSIHGLTGEVTTLPLSYFEYYGVNAGIDTLWFREFELELVEPEHAYVIEIDNLLKEVHVHKAKPSATPIIGRDTRIGSCRTLKLAERYVEFLKENADA